MAMNVNFTNPRPPAMSNDPYSQQPDDPLAAIASQQSQAGQSGLASPLAQAMMQQLGGTPAYAPQTVTGSTPNSGSYSLTGVPGSGPWNQAMQTINGGVDQRGRPLPMQPSPMTYNAQNPWQDQGQQSPFLPNGGMVGTQSPFLPNGNMTGTMPGNSGIVPPGQQRGYQGMTSRPMQSPILGPMNQPSPPPFFRRRLPMHGNGGPTSGAGGFGLNPMGNNSSDRGILPSQTFV